MKIKKPQARQRPELVTLHVSERSVDEMWRLIERIALSRAWLWTAIVSHAHKSTPPPPPIGVFDRKLAV
jgi:hypothetical protein